MSSGASKTADRATFSELLILGVSLLGSSYLMAGAMDSRGQSIVAWFALFPLFVSIAVLRPWRAALAGALWGAGVHLFAASGLIWAAHPGVPSDLLTLALLVGTPAMYAALTSWLTQRIGFSPFVLGVGWLGVELVLARVNLNAGLLGPGQSEGDILHWLTHALGSVFVGFIIAYVNAACVAAVSRVYSSSLRRAFCVALCAWRRCCEAQISVATSRFLIEHCRPRAPPLHG